MSDSRHTVVFSPSLIGAGKRPSLMPFHQVEALTGIRGSMPSFASPIMSLTRRKRGWLSDFFISYHRVLLRWYEFFATFFDGLNGDKPIYDRTKSSGRISTRNRSSA